MKTLVDWINRGLLAIAGMAVVALMLLTASNVVLRLFKRPFVGTYELAGYFGALAVALVLGHTQMRKDHVAVDILTRHYPRWLGAIVDVFSCALAFVLFAAVGWRMVLWGMLLRKSGELSETLKFVYDPFVYCVAVGFFMLSVALLFDLVGAVWALVKMALRMERKAGA